MLIAIEGIDQSMHWTFQWITWSVWWTTRLRRTS